MTTRSNELPMSLRFIRERLLSRAPGTQEPEPEWLSRRPMIDVGGQNKRAAVAAVLRDGGALGPEVLLIRRAEHPSDPWSGHMAFPGGREDPTDESLLATAVRETLEELRLDLRENASLIGPLDEIPAIARGRRTGMVIAPFVFELTREVPFSPNAEVAEVLWAPLVPLMRGERATTIPYELEGQRMQLPAHDVEGRIVWGLTYKMLDALFSALR